MNTEIARAAVVEARLLIGTGGGQDEIQDALDLAMKALGDDEITDAELDDLHPSVAHRLRDQGNP